MLEGFFIFPKKSLLPPNKTQKCSSHLGSSFATLSRLGRLHRGRLVHPLLLQKGFLLDAICEYSPFRRSFGVLDGAEGSVKRRLTLFFARILHFDRDQGYKLSVLEGCSICKRGFTIGSSEF